MDISLEHTVGNPANTDFFNQMYIVNAQQNQVKFTIAAGWSWKGFFLLININVYPNSFFKKCVLRAYLDLFRFAHKGIIKLSWNNMVHNPLCYNMS